MRISTATLFAALLASALANVSANASTVVAFSNTSATDANVNEVGTGYTMVGGTSAGQNIEEGQLFKLSGFTTGTLSSVDIWASNSTTPMTYTMSVYSVNPAHGQLGSLLETLSGSTPADPGNVAPHFDFITLTSTAPASVTGNTDYWFVVTEAPPAGYWAAEKGTTPLSNTVGGTTLNGLFTTVGVSGTTLTSPGASNAPALQETLVANVSTVPLPAAVWLMVSGLGGLGFVSRRRNRR